MALSNWDTLAINKDGKPAPGRHTFTGGTTLEIYKNWCYVSNEKMYVKESSFEPPVIASINGCDMNLAGLTIKAIRGKQDSIFLFAQAGHEETFEVFAGIGCYGYGNTFEQYCKEHNIEYIPYDYTSSIWVDGKQRESVGWWEPKSEMVLDEGTDLHPWVGVEPGTLADFKAWLQSLDEVNNGWFNKINWDELVRFNQGDFYFAQHMGVPLPNTAPGQSEQPVIMEMLKHIKPS